MVKDASVEPESSGTESHRESGGTTVQFKIKDQLFSQPPRNLECTILRGLGFFVFV